MNMKLFSAKICPFAQRTRITLKLKHVDYETAEVDFAAPRSQEHLESNPLGAVPTLVHDGRALFESNVINEYLEEVFPEPSLMPKEPWQRAVSRILMDYCNASFNKPFYEFLKNQDRKRDEELRNQVIGSFKFLNDCLMKWSPSGTYVWETFGLADIAFAPFFKRFVLLEHYRAMTFPESPEFRRVLRWRNALISHHAVLETSLSDEEYITAYEVYARGA